MTLPPQPPMPITPVRNEPGMPPPMPVPPQTPPPVPPVQAGPPPLAMDAPLPTPVPADMAMGLPPEPKPIPPPRPGKDAKLAHRQKPEDIKNPFERTASLLVETAEDYAKALAGNLSEQAADTVEVSPQKVNEMMQFSPYGVDAANRFWAVHDRLLQEAANNSDPDPYAVAERGALDEVYPYRARLAMLDILAPEQRVSRANELMRTASHRSDDGEGPETMPFMVGPRGMPTVEQPAPAAPPPAPPAAPGGY